MSASGSRMPSGTELRLGGFTRLSTTDWPGELAATVFTQGCPWDCPYCHNPHLQEAAAESPLSWSDVRSFLETRVGLLDAVVFSGGEPTAQQGLADAMTDVRTLGFRVGLHTGGPHPARLGNVLGLVGWLGFDVKAPFDEYDGVTRATGSGTRALESLRMAIASGVDVEVRTTVHPDVVSPGGLARLAASLRSEGVERWVLQRYRATGTRGLLRDVFMPEADVLAAVAGGPRDIVLR